MPLTKATTNVVNLDKDTTINGVRVGKGAGSSPDNDANTCVGSLNLSNNTTGYYNTSIGHAAMFNNTTGVDNTAVGVSALNLNTGGIQNVAIGVAALRDNTTGRSNSAVGQSALQNNTTGQYNTALGYAALLSNTFANSNTAVGSSALQSNTIGASNTAVGGSALSLNTTGIQNTAVGVDALQNNTTGINNTAVGTFALITNTVGSGNTGIGYSALQQNTTGADNIAVGINALVSNTTGSQNTACGSGALSTNTTFSNVGGFGYNAQVSGSNQIRIGDTNITSVTCQTNAWSDERDKADIRDTVLGLDFIKELRPVDYKWDYREDYRPEAPAIVNKPAELKEDASDEEKAKYAEELAAYNAYKVKLDKWLEDCKWSNLVHDGTHKRTRFHHGLIAQEVKAVIEKTGIDFGGFQDHTIKGGDEVMTIGYTELIGPLIKAVQELSAKVAELEAK